MINSNDNKSLINYLEGVKYKTNEGLLSTTEYRDQYNVDRLKSGFVKTESYVSKRANDESEFWKGGRHAYEDKKMKDEVIYKTTTRQDMTGSTTPANLDSSDYNMRKTRISEYSNALFNGNVFINPSYLSC